MKDPKVIKEDKPSEKAEAQKESANTPEEIEAWLKLVHEGPCCGHPIDNQFSNTCTKQD